MLRISKAGKQDHRHATVRKSGGMKCKRRGQAAMLSMNKIPTSAGESDKTLRIFIFRQ
jgi:hypothetical protein